MITSVAFFCYPVTNIAKAREFYEAILGLKFESDFGNDWVEYDVNGSTFAITTMDTTHIAGAKGGVVAFEVDDLDATIRDLQKNKVKFVSGPGESPVCRFAVIADPDGNEVIVHKRKP